MGLDTLTRVPATAKGLTLTMEATERLHGKVRIDLGESAAPIKDVARVLMIEVLEKNDMLPDEVRDWRLLLVADAISLDGRLTSEGLRRLTELIPFPADTVDLRRGGSRQVEGSTGSTRTGIGSPRHSKVTASKKKFQRISQRHDDLSTEVEGAQKAKFAQEMLNDAAQEIDRLPVLNVDWELLAYGAGVSSSLRNMRNLSKNAGLDYQHRKAEIQGDAGYGNGCGGFYGRGPSPKPPRARTVRSLSSCNRTNWSS